MMDLEIDSKISKKLFYTCENGNMWQLANMLYAVSVEELRKIQTLAIIGRDALFGNKITAEDFIMERKIANIQPKEGIVSYLVNMQQKLPIYLTSGLVELKKCTKAKKQGE